MDNHQDKQYFVDIIASMAERTIKRLWILVVVAVAALIITNIAWICYINQYDFADYSYEQDGLGVNIIDSGNEVQHGAEIESPHED